MKRLKKEFKMVDAEVVLRYGYYAGQEKYFPVLSGRVEDKNRGFIIEDTMVSSPILSYSYDDDYYVAVVETANSIYKVVNWLE